MSLADLGVYGVAFRITAIVTIFLSLISTSFVPIIYKNYKNENTKKDVVAIYRYTFFASFLLIAFLSIFSNEILFIIATPEYYKGNIILPFLLLSVFFMQFSNLFLGLSIVAKTRTIAIINFTGSILSVILNLLLIPYLGLLGAALSASAVALTVFIIQFHFSQKYFYIPVKYQSFVYCFCISLVFIVVTNILFQSFNYTGVFVKTLVYLAYILINIRLSGIVEFHEFKILLNKIRAITKKSDQKTTSK
jgi:O-antigen/teichoic acid export membrane protein